MEAFGVGLNPFRVVGRPDLQPVCPKPVHHVHHLVAVSVPYELAYVHVIGVCVCACNSVLDIAFYACVHYVCPSSYLQIHLFSFALHIHLTTHTNTREYICVDVDRKMGTQISCIYTHTHTNIYVYI